MRNFAGNFHARKFCHTEPMKILFTLLSVLSSVLLSAQPNPEFESVDHFARSINIQTGNRKQLLKVIDTIRGQFNNDEARVRAAFVWVTEHVQYDCGSYSDPVLSRNSIDAILKTGKSVCSGFANIFEFMCRQMGIECVNINGFAKTSAKDLLLKADSMRNNHTWNAVKISGMWKLIDVTWASGYADENCSTVVKEFADQYFFMPPEQMILTHYPADSNWQLLKNRMSREEFLGLPILHDSFFKSGITEFEPGQSTLEAPYNGLLVFKFKSSRPLEKIGIWSPDASVPQEWAQFTRRGDYFVFYYYVKGRNDYILNISLNGTRTSLIYKIKVQNQKKQRS